MLDAIDKLIEDLKNEMDTLKSRQVLSDEAIKHLHEIYSIAWVEACYDPYNEKSYEAAVRILPHIKALNDELKFKT